MRLAGFTDLSRKPDDSSALLTAANWPVTPWFRRACGFGPGIFHYHVCVVVRSVLLVLLCVPFGALSVGVSVCLVFCFVVWCCVLCLARI